MIITRTPLRISLVGGGTDMAAYYHQANYGAVVSLGINKYVYVTFNLKFDGRTRVSYSEIETVNDPIDLKHELIRGALGYFQIKGLDITTIADIPGEGSGLGSSSALTVGLVLGLLKLTGKPINVDPGYFADMAYELEKTRCRHIVGKQDHYASAYGGLHYYQFNQDESVVAETLQLPESTQHRLEQELLLFWTGRTRQAAPILEDQWERFKKGDWWMIENGDKLRDLAVNLAEELRHGNVENIGSILHENWRLKKRLSHSISTPEIDELYEKAISAGASGGKLCGAGGGGFLLFYVKTGRGLDVEKAMGKLRRVPWKLSSRGATVIHPHRNGSEG